MKDLRKSSDLQRTINERVAMIWSSWPECMILVEVNRKDLGAVVPVSGVFIQASESVTEGTAKVKATGRTHA